MFTNSSTNKGMPQASELFQETGIQSTPLVQHQQDQTETESSSYALLCISPVRYREVFARPEHLSSDSISMAQWVPVGKSVREERIVEVVYSQTVLPVTQSIRPQES